MIEILFRGKRTDTGEWICGSLCYDLADQPRIMPKCIFGTVIMDENNKYNQRKEGLALGGFYPVVLESVGQFTGLQDKNGNKIFEGDILKTMTEKNMTVSWSEKFASFCLFREGWAFTHWFGEACSPEDCEVIGNIHENPDLLKEVHP